MKPKPISYEFVQLKDKRDQIVRILRDYSKGRTYEDIANQIVDMFPQNCLTESSVERALLRAKEKGAVQMNDVIMELQKEK